ncbi:MAG: hypothetical protein KAI43_07800 [Candidatus Aureabacteria bacterium]|nr:hypothetical protein [Candidatus Auribacterota bacterium]
MDLFLQMGHGMKAHCLELFEKWSGGTAILSPKNMDLAQLIATSEEIHKSNGQVMFDPQFYIPRTSQENLQDHSFWPEKFSTSKFFNGSGIDTMIDVIINDYINPMNADAFIIPTLFLSEINADWDTINSIIIKSLSRYDLEIPKYLTLCISENILKSENKIHSLLEQIEEYPIDGFYVIPQHPKDDYLIDNVTWLTNLMDLSAGMKILGYKVIVGYSSHQLLLLSLAKVDAMASGIWLKTRMFPLGDFDDSDDSNGGRRSTWYYCPQALSEYQIPFLDAAHKGGFLDELRAPDIFDSGYANILFKGAEPSTVRFSEREAFRHYLHCLKVQCNDVSKSTYIETKEYLKLIFETALDLTTFFRENGVRGKHRDFSNVGDSNIAAVDTFENIRGLIYKNSWNSI